MYLQLTLCKDRLGNLIEQDVDTSRLTVKDSKMACARCCSAEPFAYCRIKTSTCPLTSLHKRKSKSAIW